MAPLLIPVSSRGKTKVEFSALPPRPCVMLVGLGGTLRLSFGLTRKFRLMEVVQQRATVRATKMMKCLEGKTCEKWLKPLGLFSPNRAG